jgi:hypothetical protein
MLRLRTAAHPQWRARAVPVARWLQAAAAPPGGGADQAGSDALRGILDAYVASLLTSSSPSPMPLPY